MKKEISFEAIERWLKDSDWRARMRPFLLLAMLAVACFCVKSAEAEEVPSGVPAQILEIRRSKAQHSPPPEKPEAEAVLFPWANKIEGCVITYYDICEMCCGKSDGITASGSIAVPYETCAVDPKVIPIGSTMIAEYSDGTIQHLRAEDTGSGVKGNHIDICVAGHREAVELGVQTATVYWNSAEGPEV